MIVIECGIKNNFIKIYIDIFILKDFFILYFVIVMDIVGMDYGYSKLWSVYLDVSYVRLVKFMYM